MVAPIVAAEAGKRGLEAGKALAGDIYTRRWTSVKGKGKKKHEVQHEVRLNPVVLAVGAAATAVGVGTALWVSQLRLVPAQAVVEYGKWMWPDGKDASKELDKLKRGAPRYRLLSTTGAPRFEYAHWVATRTDTQMRVGIRERSGFLGNGVGTAVGDVPWYIKAVSPITWPSLLKKK